MILQADAASLPLADRCVDLVFGSPPYCDARTYGIGADRKCAEWVEWMLPVTTECLRVCRGAVVWILGSVTRDRNYWPAPEGLAWEWYKRGGSMYRPCFWYRVGVPGSGGDQWFRSDVEYVLCFKREGPLPWTDNTAMGHPPKYAPGGTMSHRLSDGARMNQWGHSHDTGGTVQRGEVTRSKTIRPSHRQITKTNKHGDVEVQNWVEPAIANPGNMINIAVGGGHLGSKIAHENEAPFPEKLAEWFVLSLCPKGGTVFDPFSGSGTTASVAAANGREYVASDIRESQCRLTSRRLTETQTTFEAIL